MKNKVVVGLLLAAMAAGIGIFHVRNAGVDVSERPGAQLADSENRPVNFTDFKGRVVIINNWASWCPPCIAEMQSIQQLKKELNSEGIAFVMVSFDEDFDKAENFMKKRGYDLSVYFPGKKYPFATASIPVTIVLDAKGNVVLQHEGMLDYMNGEFVNKIRTMID